MGADEAKITPAAGNNDNNDNSDNSDNEAASGAGNGVVNLQAFSGSLGGIDAPTVTEGGRGFEVENNADFLNLSAAIGRSCDVQKNQCANAANSGADFSVSDCDAQAAACRAAA